MFGLNLEQTSTITHILLLVDYAPLSEIFSPTWASNFSTARFLSNFTSPVLSNAHNFQLRPCIFSQSAGRMNGRKQGPKLFYAPPLVFLDLHFWDIWAIGMREKTIVDLSNMERRIYYVTYCKTQRARTKATLLLPNLIFSDSSSDEDSTLGSSGAASGSERRNGKETTPLNKLRTNGFKKGDRLWPF